MNSIAINLPADKQDALAPAGGFTMIPNDLLERGDISPGAKLTYIGLLRFAWREGFCFPGQERLAAMLGMGVRTVIRHLQELARAGLILLERRGRGKTNCYLFPKTCQNGRSRRAESADPEVPNLQPIKTQRDKDTETKTQSSNTRKTLRQSVSSLREINPGRKPVPELTPRPGPRPAPEPHPVPMPSPRPRPAPMPRPTPTAVEGASPCLQQLWEATQDGAQLMVQLRRDFGQLDSISWHDGVLSLKAPASDVLRRVQRMAPEIVHDLQPTAPVPLRVIEIV